MAFDAAQANTDELERNFRVNLYCWARTTIAEQVRADFPLLRLIQSSVAERFFAFVRSFDKNEQLRFTSALVKRAHRDALLLIDEWLSPEEDDLITKFLNSPFPPSAYEREMMAKYASTAAENTTTGKWNQGTLKKLLAQTAKEVYSGAVLKWGMGEADIALNVGRLRVITSLDIHDRWRKFSYFHRIYRDEREFSPMIQPFGIWGIGGTDWELAESPEQVNRGFRTLSEHFLSTLPLLFRPISLPGLKKTAEREGSK
jgi:hypothetical protein